MNLRLKDGTEYPVFDSSTDALVRMELESLEEVEDIRKSLTKDNLAAFEYTDDAGKAYGKYGHHVVASVSLDALEEGQETQDGAIEELAGMMGGGE